MSADLLLNPLRLSCTFTRGSRSVIRIEDRHNPQLARELATGLVALVHPHGRLDAERTVTRFAMAIAWFTEALAADGYTGPAAGLTRGRLAQAWWSGEHRRESATRRMLAALDDMQPTLSREAREFVDGRHFNHAKEYAPLEPYAEGEWKALEKHCRRLVDESYAEHRRVMEAATRGGDPMRHSWTHENVCWKLARSGPVSARELSASLGFREGFVQERFPGFLRVVAAMFPQNDVMIPYQLLLGIYTGIVPDGVSGLDAHDIDWAGDSAVLLNYVKGRAAEESLTLNSTAVRLLEQWLKHSAPMRPFAPADRRHVVWLRHLPKYGRWDRWQTKPVVPMGMTTWLRAQQRNGAAGLPAGIHRHRTRTTFESLRDRDAWFGSPRATIDPNHSPQVEGDRYLATPTSAQRRDIETIIEAAQADLLRRAQPPRVLTADELAGFAGRFPELVADLELDEVAIAELVGGQRDVFVAACADPLSGQFGPAGKPCPARPWVCLLCPLAVFTPRHAPNLLRLSAYFARRWQQMPAAHFMAIFGPYAQRIDEVLDVFRDRVPEVLTSAGALVADTDDELPLLPEERTA